MIYQIGNFIFKIHTEETLCLPPNFQKFQHRGNVGRHDIQMHYNLKIADELPKLQGQCIFERPDIAICRRGILENREMRFVGSSLSYGVYQEIDDQSCCCYLKKEFQQLIREDTVFLSLLAVEKQMEKQNAMILHCSVVKYGDCALLFSGPSGIGKSTHAALWEKQKNARIINGDRALIRKKNGQWAADGWPVCGSSGICHNECYPIRAIIFLGQSDENRGEKLSFAQSIKHLISQTTINRWNAASVQKIWSLTEELAAEIPVYFYSCNTEQGSVAVLEQLIADS